jgi:hypothetical protein
MVTTGFTFFLHREQIPSTYRSTRLSAAPAKTMSDKGPTAAPTPCLWEEPESDEDPGGWDYQPKRPGFPIPAHLAETIPGWMKEKDGTCNVDLTPPVSYTANKSHRLTYRSTRLPAYLPPQPKRCPTKVRPQPTPPACETNTIPTKTHVQRWWRTFET